MKNNESKDNSLIKKNQLIKILKSCGIKRFKKESLRAIGEKISDELKKDAKLMARRLMLEGRKTLTEQDVTAVLAAKEKEERGFEI